MYKLAYRSNWTGTNVKDYTFFLKRNADWFLHQLGCKTAISNWSKRPRFDVCF